MIPSVLARQLRRGVADFLKTSFTTTTPYFEGLWERFLADPDHVFRGPFYHFALPFEAADRPWTFDRLDLASLIPQPWHHQLQAWERLSGTTAKSTVIATGTGSGKTECFLYPILDYCSANRGPGIKAILLYPMNALATDQARRMASTISNQAGLHGLRAGLFIGDIEEAPVVTMSAAAIISDKETLRRDPPDILLTNYKMLDLLLLRPEDRRLWSHPSLHYLVVDELHSFDGAQGTDLACLIRRLRARLHLTTADLVCVGTSATLGGQEELAALADFASQIFSTGIAAGDIVLEKRQDAQTFLSDRGGLDGDAVEPAIPSRSDFERLDPYFQEYGGDTNRYLTGIHRLWFPGTDAFNPETEEERVALGHRLKAHTLFQSILKSGEGRPLSLGEYRSQLSRILSVSRSWSEDDLEILLASLTALVSHARRLDGGRLVPFLNIRVQFWMRELKRLVVSVPPSADKAPELAFADDLKDAPSSLHLPLVHCRECQSTAWVSVKSTGSDRASTDLREVYNAYFTDDTDTLLLYPWETEHEAFGPEHKQSLCRKCGTLYRTPGNCPVCQEEGAIPVFVPDIDGQVNCPYCGSSGDLAIMGSKAASLIGVFLGQLYASPLNDDKKALAFSDSVQDAAQRAGFFSARTWQFTFRTAVQRFLKASRNENGSGLLDFAHDCIGFLKERYPEHGNFIGRFLPPDMEWREDYESLVRTGRIPPGSSLAEQLEHRLEWEIVSEYGYRTRIGRTLERSASSVAQVDMVKLIAALDAALPILCEHQDRFRLLGSGHDLLSFALGLFMRLKTDGAIDMPALVSYRESGGNRYLLSRIDWMPPFSSRSPRYPTLTKAGHFDPILPQNAANRTWFQRWYSRCMESRLQGGFVLTSIPDESQFWTLLLGYLVHGGLLVEFTAQDKGRTSPGWAVNPSALHVTGQVMAFRCGSCGHSVMAGEAEAPFWGGVPCLRHGCGGTYGAEELAADNYYRSLYASGESERIVAREHTGLLERDERQELEKHFMDRRNPWDPNLLSATPTLEMGINIGDLSTVLLCSIPPSVASYVQRIGRGGRRDGNALTVAVANARPHDLSFFLEPVQMIRGRVDPPGIYLSASAVLQRQLMAFVFDHWLVETSADENRVPRRLGSILDVIVSGNAARFPFSLYTYTGAAAGRLASEFRSLFPEVDRGIHDALSESLRAEEGELPPLMQALDDSLHRSLEEKRSWDLQLRRLREKIRENRNETVRSTQVLEELDALTNEKDGIARLRKTLMDRNSWAFFCDEGLLPNYAFPETGVQLRSLFWRKTQPGSGKKYTYITKDYQRPAGIALEELAPENEFYAGGRKVTVDRVDLKSSTLETWRFCPDCAHAAPLGSPGYSDSVCPRCGHAGWFDSGQILQLLRLRQVYSRSELSRSQIGDDAEEREPLFYSKRLLIDFQPADRENIYFASSGEGFPVAVEFIKAATFREVNFGKKNAKGIARTIAGTSEARPGFMLCPECGAVKKWNTFEHAPECSRYGSALVNDDTLKVSYLYRDYVSEAIRLLIPVLHSGLDAETRMESMKAALYLGLKRRFGGKVDHLFVSGDSGPSADGRRLDYLVIHDTVPGGSGYLHTLFRDAYEGKTDNVFQILRLAREALTSCTCHEADEPHDGCYRCIHAYRTSYRHDSIRKSKALEVLDYLLSKGFALVKLAAPVAARVESLFESELELRFVEALRRIRLPGVEIRLTPEIFRGKCGNVLKIGNREYHLEQQVVFNAAQGVSEPSRADFGFFPIGFQAPPVIVFTDGWQYHQDRIARDISQRQSLIKSGRLVWTLSWQDVEDLLNPSPTIQRASVFDPVPASVPPREKLGIGEEARAPMSLTAAFQQLLYYLAKPDPKAWSDEFAYRSLAWIGSGARVADGDSSPLDKCFPSLLRSWGEVPKVSRDLNGFLIHAAFSPAIGRSASFSPSLVAVLALLSENPSESAWNGYWSFANAAQFVPNFILTEAAGIEEGIYDDAGKGAPVGASAEPPDTDWAEVLACCLESWRDLLSSCAHSKLDPPELGYALTDPEGIIIAEAEAVWPSRKRALLNTGQAERTVLWQGQGWSVLTWSPSMGVAEIKELLQ